MAANPLLRRNLDALRALDPALAKLAAGQPGTPARPSPSAGGSGHPPCPDLPGGVSLLALVGLGPEAADLRGALGPDGRQLHNIVVIEPSPDTLRRAVRSVDLRRALSDPRVAWFVGLAPLPLTRALFDWVSDPVRLRLMNTAHVIAATDQQTATVAVQAINQAFGQALLSCGNAAIDGLRGLENLVRNIPTIVASPGIDSWVGKLRGRPAVLASAGPSLVKQLDALSDLPDDVLLICPDTSVRPLQEIGVRPHIACSKERMPGTEGHFAGVDDPDMHLVASPVLFPACFDMRPDSAVMIFRDAGHFEWLGPGLQRRRLEFRGSSSNMAFRLAQDLGCDPIILIGQDLAYADDGTTHIPGTVHGSTQSVIGQAERIAVPGYAGGTVQSMQFWVNFRDIFELDIATRPGATWNCTEGGALIRGAVNKPFRQAIQELRDRRGGPGSDVRDVLRDALRRPTPASQERETKAYQQRVAQTRRALTAAIEACREGRQRIQALVARLHAEGPPSDLEGQRPDVRQLLTHALFQPVERLREQVMADRITRSFILPSSLSTSMHWEVRLFALQREHPDAASLCAAVAPQLAQWFDVHLELLVISEALLAWGDHALGLADAPPLPDEAVERIVWADAYDRAFPAPT